MAARFQGEWKTLGFAIGLMTTTYYMYVATFGTFSPALDRSLFIYVGVALSICCFPLAQSLVARLGDGNLALALGDGHQARSPCPIDRWGRIDLGECQRRPGNVVSVNAPNRCTTPRSASSTR